MTIAHQPNADEVRETVAANLRATLKQNRWSERKAADALGLTPAYVNRRASGDTDLSSSDLAMFARFLNVPVQHFFTQITNWSLATVTELHPRSVHPSVHRQVTAKVTAIHAHR